MIATLASWLTADPRRATILLLWAALTLAWLLRDLARWWRRWRLQRRFDRARRLEERAAAQLERAGYAIQAAQASRVLELSCDGERRRYELRLDYLVEDAQGQLFIAEVKSGARAPDPLFPATRRQLLEYRYAWPEADGLLLVDAERGAIQEVRFLGAAQL